jgi:hypothetical protein
MKSDITMAKKIKITQQQLEETVNKIRVNEENVELALGGSETAPIEQRAKETLRVASSNGVNTNNVDIKIPDAKKVLNCSKNIFTKSQLLEARKNFLKENSTSYSKTNFLKRK